MSLVILVLLYYIITYINTWYVLYISSWYMLSAAVQCLYFHWAGLSRILQLLLGLPVFPTNTTLLPLCLLSWWGKRSKKYGEHGGLTLAQGQVRKKRVVCTKPMTHMTIWSYCFKLTPFVASMKNKHQPETWVYLKSGTISILKSSRAKSSCAQPAKLREPALPASLSFPPAVRNQVSPTSPVHSRHVWCRCCYWTERATAHLTSVEPWYPGNQFLKPNHLSTRTHPPTPFPSNCSLMAEKHWIASLSGLNNSSKQPPSINTPNSTFILFSTLEVQNSYSKWNLLPIDQHGYKCWACFCLVNILPS